MESRSRRRGDDADRSRRQPQHRLLGAELRVEEALNALDAEFGKVIKNSKQSGEPEQSTLNGMTTYNVEGTGEVNGVPIEWSGHLIEAKKPAIALSFAAPGAYEKHEKDVEAFVKSIKKPS